MTVAKGCAYPYKNTPPTLHMDKREYHSLSPQSLSGYGRYIEDITNPPAIEQIAYIDPDPRSFRPADPGTGLNQSVIKGDFTSYYNPSTQTIEACNLAVKSKGAENADYTIGWAHENIADCFRVVEFNNHKDAGQQFIIHQGEGALFLLGTTPQGTDPKTQKPTQVHSDFIDPLIDLAVFYAPQGTGFEVSPHVYHQPLYPLSQREEVVALSIQGSIHNCTTCDFVAEMGFDVGLQLDTPKHSEKSFFLSQLLSRYQWIVQSPYPNGAIALASFSEQSQSQLLAIVDRITLPEKMSTTYQPTTLNDFKAMLSIQKQETEKRARLITAIKARIAWLEKAGRYLIHKQNAYLYNSDMFGLSSLLLALYPEKPVFTLLQQGSASALDNHLTPYQQVLKQKQALVQ